MPPMEGSQQKILSNALQEAFPTLEEFSTFLRFELNLNLASVTSTNLPLRHQVFQTIQYTESRGLTPELIEAARRTRPANTDFLKFASKAGTIIETPRPSSLEKILSDHDIVFDVADFRQRILNVERRVCLIEIRGRKMGTGFLVGPDRVLTNHHVVAPVIKGRAAPSEITLRFDYKELADGTKLKGVEWKLADHWLLSSSPHSKFDTKPNPKGGLPTLDELDYALLQVDGAPGDTPISNYAEQFDEDAPKRGHIDLPFDDDFPSFKANPVLFIVQHPRGQRMKLTVNAVRGYNENKTRVTYMNSTEGGSSGSPVFNGNWELVALHHSGDPDKIKPEYNEGIPINLVAAALPPVGNTAADDPTPNDEDEDSFF